MKTTENNSAAGAFGSVDADTTFFDLDRTWISADGDLVIVSLHDPAAGERTTKVAQVYASAPSGKGFTGQVAVYADSTLDVCTVHGHLALQG